MPAISTLIKLPRSLAPVIQPPISGSNTSFKLDFAGLTGFFGGETAWSALATSCLMRTGLGGCNSPGAYEVARRYAPLANHRFWDAIFPSERQDPAEILGLETKRVPVSLRASGETVRTGHAGYLIARQAASEGHKSLFPSCAATFLVTIIDLPSTVESNDLRPGPLIPEPSEFTRAMQGVLRSVWPGSWPANIGVIVFNIAGNVSIAAAILCALVRDWWCFASILTGIIAGFTLGPFRGRLMFSTPPAGRARGEQEEMGREEQDGLLLHQSDGHVVILRGNKTALAGLTRGRFRVRLRAGGSSLWIHVALAAQVIQFLTQLVLIPQGTLFGQLMFLKSIGVSWLYNVWLAMQQDPLQTRFLLRLYYLDDSSFQTTTLQSPGGMAVFACLALRHLPHYDPRKLLDELITEEGVVGAKWKELVARELLMEEANAFRILQRDEKDDLVTPLAVKRTEDVQDLTEDQKLSLLERLRDAEDAFRMAGWKTPANPDAGVETPGRA